MPRRYYSSIAQRTTLSADINASQTSMTVAAVTGFPSSFPFTIIVDQDTVNEEVMEVSSRSGTTLTVVRGVDGTTGVSHTAGATVNHGVSARDFSEPNVFINEGGTLTAASASSTPLTVKGAASQSAALVVLADNANTTRFVAKANGHMQIAPDTDATPTNTASDSHFSISGNGYGGFISLDASGMWVGHNSASRSLILATNETERMRISSNGNVGVGTSSPFTQFVVGNESSTGVIGLDSSGAINGGGRIVSRKARGTLTSPTATQANDSILDIEARGYGTTGYNAASRALIRFFAAEAHTDSAQGTYITFNTTEIGSTTVTERMRISNDGKVGIGRTPAASLDVNQDIRVTGTTGTVSLQCIGDGAASSILGARYTTDGTGPQLSLYKYRGSVASPTVVASGDDLGLLRWYGYDGADLREAVRITGEVDGTPGTNDMPGRLTFHTTPDGSATLAEAMRINNGQELLIGYTADNGAYKLQVNSQIFATSATIATSDGRYKDNVETLDGGWDMIKALRPVAFDWKPQQDVVDSEGNLVREAHNFPDGRQIGFIAQEVQEALADHPWISNLIKENRRPEVVAEDGTVAPAETFYGIAEGNLIAVLCSALQEAQSRIESLEARLDAAGL